jgi:RNA recognition motif-containing protein
MKKKLFVGNLSWKTTEEQLKAFFETCGEVVDAKVITDKATGRSKGFGFIEMATDEDAQAAIQKLNGQKLGDRELRVSLAQERTDRPERGGYDRGQGGRGDRRERNGESFASRGPRY